MPTITLNPGFVLIAAAVAVLAAPAPMRAATMALAALGAMWMLLAPEFGAYDAFAQIGMTVVPFALDELNSVFGLAFLGAAVFLAIYAGARGGRYECAAITLFAGAAVAALFAGDFISYVAGASLAGLAGAWVVFARDGPGAGAAGVRLLIWHGLEGLLYLAGVAVSMSSQAGGAPLQRLSLDTLGGVFVFGALMIRVGAPLAHVWLKDAVAHASGAGACALTAFSTMLGVYALARVFPGEAALAPIGAAMIVVGAFYAGAQDDLRQAGAYALTAQTGVCVAMIGLGSPLALSASAAHAFACVFGFLLLQMALGALAERFGVASAALVGGAARTMPITAAFCVAGALAVIGAPGLAGYASLMLALEAAAAWEHRWLWAAIGAGAGVMAAGFAARVAVTLFANQASARPRGETPFAMLLAMSLALFLCLTVGLAPSWLYDLTPATALSFQAFAPDRLGPALQLIGAAGAVYLILRRFGVAPAAARRRLADVDALYRGPISAAGRWAGFAVLGWLGAFSDRSGGVRSELAARAAALVRSADQPYAAGWSGAAGLVVLLVLLGLVLLARI